MKQANKKRLKEWVKNNCGEKIDENSLFDVQVN
jgi:glucan phosphorylase